MYTMGQAIRQLREAGEPDGFLYSDEALFTKKKIEKPLVAHFKPDYAPDYLLCCNYICHLAVFRRELFEQVGGERPECDGSQDHDLFLRLIEQVGGAAHVPQVLYYWRVHEGSTSGGTDAKPYVAKAAKKALADHLERTGCTGTIEDGLYPSTYRVRWDIVGGAEGEHPHPQQGSHRGSGKVPAEHLEKRPPGTGSRSSSLRTTPQTRPPLPITRRPGSGTMA